jgi:hypothetical protein
MSIVANDLIKALEGRWINSGIGLIDGAPVGTDNFIEILAAKDEHTLSIKCEGLRTEVASASDWRIELIGDDVSMDQGSYVAKGRRQNNVCTLVGYDEGKEIRHRIVVLGDKVAFLREIWSDGKAIQIDFSYLVRTSKS